MSTRSIECVELPGQFAQVQLGAMKEIVTHHREGGLRVQFDATELERIDGAAIQFLLAVSKLQLNDAQNEPLIVNANDILNKALADMGLESLTDTALSDYEGDTVSPR